ncbi:MAG: hypothetical protein VKL42_08525 [Snowella sp.]|nr:hypothetical protein [Snowella sp.]
MGIKVQQFNTIGTWMKAERPTDLPAILQGVFFMDGNGLPDDCLTFYNAQWEPEYSRLLLQVFAPQQWTFHASIQGKLLLYFVKLTRLTYLIRFDDHSLQRAEITPILLGLSVPTWLIKFILYRDTNSPNGDIWYRENIILTKLDGGGYTLRKVVDGQGQKTDAFAAMLSKVGPRCYVIV